MMVNIGTRIAPVNIAFSSSRNAALNECKVLQYTTITIKLHHCTLSVIKSSILPCRTSLLVSQYIAWIRNNTRTHFLTKSINYTLQTCVDLANEYLQTYNTGAGVQNRVFCSLHQCKCAVDTMLLFAFVL